MRIFTSNGKYEYGELQTEEKSTGKNFTFTQKHQLFKEDFYGISRFIACENVHNNEVAEKEFYVYEVSYMPDGYSCLVAYVDEQAAEKLISENLIKFLHGSFSTEDFRKYM